MQSPITRLRPPGWAAEFRAFILRGNVVDLAVGIIIGVAFGGIVTSLVKDILNPIIGLAIGGVDFSNIFITLNGQHYGSLDAAQKAGAPTVNIGLFINTILNFLIVSFAIFWLVKATSRLGTKGDPAALRADENRRVADRNPRPSAAANLT